MTKGSNPFVRGYDKLGVHRVLLIICDDDSPPVFRPLHESQAHLTDEESRGQWCVYGADFALVTGGRSIPDDLDIRCPNGGTVGTVLYSIEADEAGAPVHIGDTYSNEAAREVIRRLTFEIGHFSRSWEISSGHLTEEALQYLEKLADTDTPTGLFFEAFRMPTMYAVGVKLIATPWTNDHLLKVDGRDAEDLRRQHQRTGVPDSLVHVMHLAALADARFIVFDSDARILDGLPVYDE